MLSVNFMDLASSHPLALDGGWIGTHPRIRGLVMLRRNVLAAALLLLPAGCDGEPGHASWQRASWSPDNCVVTYAVDPAQVLPQRSWKPCSYDVSGCLVWSGTFDLDGVHRYNGRTIFSGRGDGADISVYDVDQGPIAAWVGHGCTLGDIHLSAVGAVLQMAEAYYPSQHNFLLYGSVDRVVDGSADHMWAGAQDATPGYEVVRALLGTTRIALQDELFKAVVVVDTTTQAITRIADGVDDTLVAVRDDEVLFERHGVAPDANGIGLVQADGSVIMLYQKPGSVVENVASDGIDVAWAELPQGGGSPTVWSSPWASDPASFQARNVAPLPEEDTHSRVGAGYYATRSSLVRLSDGRRFDVPAPPGDAWLATWGVVGGELWSIAADTITHVHHIVRMPIASLTGP